jgi:hypothetical protein
MKDECYFCINTCDGSNKTVMCPAFMNTRNGEYMLPIENDPLELGKRRLLSKSELCSKFVALYDPEDNE